MSRTRTGWELSSKRMKDLGCKFCMVCIASSMHKASDESISFSPFQSEKSTLYMLNCVPG